MRSTDILCISWRGRWITSDSTRWSTNTAALPATGLARVALHTGAAVVPGYAYWDETIGKYRLRFEPPVELIRTGDTERDVFENTQRFTKVIEEIIRRHPDQWVW